MLLAQSEKKLGSIFQILLNGESTFEMEIVLIAKIEQLTKQKRFLSRKLKLEEKSTGSVNENASPKNVIHFIAALFIYTKHKWLLSTGDPKRKPFILIGCDALNSFRPFRSPIHLRPLLSRL